MADEVVVFNDDLEKRIKEEFGEKATPEFMNLLRTGQAAYEHGYRRFITEEKFIEFVRDMYKAGQEQRDRREFKVKSEGGLIFSPYEIINSGSFLDVFGKRQGFLS